MGISDFFISVESLPQNGYGFVQLLFLGAVYSHILMYASHLISDGSELLLLVPSLAGIVGSVVLPVLGAVPDGCIVLFSGIGPNAQVSFVASAYLLMRRRCRLDLVDLCNQTAFRMVLSSVILGTTHSWCRCFRWVHDHATNYSLVSKHCLGSC